VRRVAQRGPEAGQAFGNATEKVVDDLVDVTYPAARRVLARIPIDADGSLVREVPQDSGQPTRTAAALSDAAGRGLRDVLTGDPHVGPFVPLPSKDNGLDVEGVVALGSRMLVGLSGPVLRGWAVVVELAPVTHPADSRRLILGPVTAGSPAEFPYLAEFTRVHVLQPGYDYVQEFEFGLDLLLDGLEKALRDARPAQPS
jgi:hypothetical protein